MREVSLLDILSVVLSAVSMIIGLIESDYRILAWIGAGVLLIMGSVVKITSDISSLKVEQQKQRERLNIYNELIEIKSDIKMLKGVKKE